MGCGKGRTAHHFELRKSLKKSSVTDRLFTNPAAENVLETDNTFFWNEP